MLEDTNDAEVPGAGFEDDDEKLIAVQRVRFARLLEKLEGEGFDGSEHQAKLEAAGTWPAAEGGDRQDFLLDSSAVRSARHRPGTARRLSAPAPASAWSAADSHGCHGRGLYLRAQERALVDRLIEEISVDGDVFVHLTLETARLAGELQFEVMAAAENIWDMTLEDEDLKSVSRSRVTALPSAGSARGARLS